MEYMTVLDELWAANRNEIASPERARIEFHGGGHDNEPKHLTVQESHELTETVVVSLWHHNVTSINLKPWYKLHGQVDQGYR